MDVDEQGRAVFAVKTLSNDADEEARLLFIQEALVQSQFKHPNVVALQFVAGNAEHITACGSASQKKICAVVPLATPHRQKGLCPKRPNSLNFETCANASQKRAAQRASS